MRRLGSGAKSAMILIYNVLYLIAMYASANSKKRCSEYYQLPRTCFACSTFFLIKLYSFISVFSKAFKYDDNMSVICVLSTILVLIQILNDFIYYVLSEEGTPHPIDALLDIYCTQRTYFNDAPLLSYSVFKKMYLLHPENFNIVQDSIFLDEKTFKYHNTPFAMNFIDFIRALELVCRDKERLHEIEKDEAHTQSLRNKDTLYAMMRDDLNSDLAAIEKQKADAYDKIKTSTDNINEIANRLIKEAH